MVFVCPSAGWRRARRFRQRARRGGRRRPLWAAVGRLLFASNIQPPSFRYERPHPGRPIGTWHSSQCGLHPSRVGPRLRPEQRAGQSWRTRTWGEEQRARGGGWVYEDSCHHAVRLVWFYWYLMDCMFNQYIISIVHIAIKSFGILIIKNYLQLFGTDNCWFILKRHKNVLLKTWKIRAQGSESGSKKAIKTH